MVDAMACGEYLFSFFICMSCAKAFYLTSSNSSLPCEVDTQEVHFKDFDFQKFVGIWHTIWRSRSHVEEDRPQMESRHFYMKEDGKASIVYTKKMGNGDCSMSERRISPFGNASYILEAQEGTMFLLTIIEADYHSSSLLMYCTGNFRNGICAKGDQYFEIVSRDVQTVPETEFTLLSKLDELCSNTEDMVYLAAECQDGHIVVDTIPVLPVFDLNTKNGLSFALSQTNFTSAHSLTGYNMYLSNINRIIGWFTVETSDGSCSQIMSTMIKQLGKSGAHVYNRLGGLASHYPWYQWKVLYSDANYTLAYFCYSDYNKTCPREAEEVRLDGRVDIIDPAFQKKLYILLQKVCISPQNMQDLIYTTDCASVLLDAIAPITEEFEKLKKNKCTFENLVTSPYNPKVNQIEGIWYNVAAINSDPGEILYIIPNKDNGLEVFTCEQIDGMCNWNPQTRLVQLCDQKAEFIKHGINTNMTAMVAHLIRMVYINNMTFFSYECRNESQGMCEDGHLVFRIYRREPTLSKKVFEELEDFLPFFCLNISEMQTSTSFPNADNSTFNKTDIPGLSECAVENISQASNFNQTKILGYWYEIARSGLEENTLQNLVSSPHSAVVYFSQNDVGHLTFNYFAALGDKCVSNIFAGKTRPRCEEQFDGNYIARLRGESWAFFKILYTDEDNVVIMYACTYLYPDGQCASPLLHILGKEPKYTEEELQTLIDKGLEKPCIHQVKWSIPEYKINCTDFFINMQYQDDQPQEQLEDPHPIVNETLQLTTLQPGTDGDRS